VTDTGDEERKEKKEKRSLSHDFRHFLVGPGADQVLAGVETTFRSVYSLWRYEYKLHALDNQCTSV
jgi:hypothetical protein